MDISTAIRSRRSIRRYLPKRVEKDVLIKLVDLSRLYASGANLQPIRYAIFSEKDECDRIFPCLKWAGYLPEFTILAEEQPPAYIVLYSDETASKHARFDVGAAATTLMLAAREYGLDTCAIASFSETGLREVFTPDSRYKTELVLSVGYAAEQSEEVACTGNIRYYQKDERTLQVPKFSAEQVLLKK